MVEDDVGANADAAVASATGDLDDDAAASIAGGAFTAADAALPGADDEDGGENVVEGEHEASRKRLELHSALQTAEVLAPQLDSEMPAADEEEDDW